MTATLFVPQWPTAPEDQDELGREGRVDQPPFCCETGRLRHSAGVVGCFGRLSWAVGATCPFRPVSGALEWVSAS